MAHCWVHARRKLKEVFDRDSSEIAVEGPRRIAEFYKIEADIRGTAPGQRLSARQVGTAPLVADFGEWPQQQRLRITAKSRLGEKFPAQATGSSIHAATLAVIAAGHPQAQIDDLLPWNFKPSS